MVLFVKEIFKSAILVANTIWCDCYIGILLLLCRNTIPDTITDNENKMAIISENAICTHEEDKFHIQTRIVDRIYNFIYKRNLSQIIIAITGEWGIGKSSVINLLEDTLKTKGNNIRIRFDPVLEGKLEVVDLLRLFYLELYKNLKNKGFKSKRFKNVFVKLIRSMFCLANADINAPVGIGNVNYNFGKNLDNILELWVEKEITTSLSEQFVNINNLLKNINYKIYIIIDEIDRLDAKQIISFLMFSRILGGINNLICIVGIDYEQAINKLIKELDFTLIHAQNYLDKLFQITFPVYHSKHTKIMYAIKNLQSIDLNCSLKAFIEDDNNSLFINYLIGYISTIRQIKKWLLAIQKNYLVIKYSPSKGAVIAFLAVAVKYPIIIDLTSKYALGVMSKGLLDNTLLGEYRGFPLYDLGDELLHAYNKANYSDTSQRIEVATACLGFIPHTSCGVSKEDDLHIYGGEPTDEQKNNINNILKDFIRSLHITIIDDQQARSYIDRYFRETPLFFIFLLVHGFFTEKQVACYSDFFSTGVDKAIKEIINIDNNIADILVGDIVEAFHMGIPLQTTPTLSSLCELWLKKVHKTEVYNQYFMLIIVCIRKIAMEQVISEAPCTLSGEYIRSILNIFNIKKNKDGCYDISSFKKLKYDLCLMSELPTSGIPMHKKIYLEKKDNKLRYLVLHPKENYVCDELLNIDVPQGDLSQEFLNNKATYILKEVFYALNFRIEGGGITTDTINPLTKKYIHYNDIRFLRESIEDFTECTIKQILQLWIDKVNLELDAKTVVFFSQVMIVDVFVHYEQWSTLLGIKTSKEKIYNSIISYLTDSDIKTECKNKLKKELKGKYSLFVNNSELKKIIDE